VSQASIELVFDNSDGTLVGEYAAYAEISIRRKVTRDSQNSYFLNGTKCRRRDITDIFLGTGLARAAIRSSTGHDLQADRSQARRPA